MWGNLKKNIVSKIVQRELTKTVRGNTNDKFAEIMPNAWHIVGAHSKCVA